MTSYYRSPRRSSGGGVGSVVGYVALLLVVVVAAYGCQNMIRQDDIDSCRARGGQPITKSIWSGDYGKVGCIERAVQP